MFFPNDSELKIIHDYCFQGSGLLDIQTPASLREIGKGVFSQCISLCSVVLCDGLEELGEQAFQDSGLRSVRIPSSVKRL